MPSGIKSENPTSHSSPTASAAPQVRSPSMRAQNVSSFHPTSNLPAAARDVAPTHFTPLTHPPTVISPSDAQTRSHPRQGRRSGGRFDIERRCAPDHPARVYFVGLFPRARRSEPRDSRRHRANPGRNSPSRHLEKSFVDPGVRFHRSRARFFPERRRYGREGARRLPRRRFASPGESRRGLGSARGAIARAIGGRLRTFSRRRVSRGCPRGLVTLGGRVDVGNRAGRAFRSPATPSIFPLDFHLRVLIQHPVLDEPAFPREADQCRRPSARDGVPVGFVLVQTPTTIDSRRPTRELALAGGAARHGRGATRRQISRTYLFSDAIFFSSIVPQATRSPRRPSGPRGRSRSSSARSRYDPRPHERSEPPPRAAVGPPIPHLPSPRAPTLSEAKTTPPLFFSS